MIGQLVKKCTRCEKDRSIEYFYPKNKEKGYFHPYCKPCSREYVKRFATDENRAKWRVLSRTLKPRYSATKRSANSRKIEFLLTLQEYEVLIEGKSCHYCSGKLPETRGGLDRMNNSIGYTLDNCVPCCVECNRIKGCALSYVETIAVAKLLKEMRKA